jgi:hypothetical protein
MTKQLQTVLLLAVAGTLAAGCASQTRSEREFGNAVRMVTTNQVYDVGAKMYPSKEAVTGGNPDRLQKVVEAHAGDVSEGQGVQKAITPGVGGGANR